MKLFLVGMGLISSQVNFALSHAGHEVVGQSGMVTQNSVQDSHFDGLVVVGPAAEVTPQDMMKAAEVGKQIFLLSDTSDRLYSWAASAKVPVFAYPPSPADLQVLDEAIRKSELVPEDSADQYRNRVLGSQASAGIAELGSLRRKIVITSPKGGTGKTTVAVNTALLLAFCGVKTFLVDADANGGSMPFYLKYTDRELEASIVTLLKARAARNEATGGQNVPENFVLSGEYLRAFSPMPNLPTLKFIPGVDVKGLNESALQNGQVAYQVMGGIFDSGAAAGGVTLMDVGINPSLWLHRAALAQAEAIAVVIKPELPDIAQTRQWLLEMIAVQAQKFGSEAAAREFVLSRIVICYNMVPETGYEGPHKILERALGGDFGIKNLDLTPRGILPSVPASITQLGVNSKDPKDMLVWKYKAQRTEELAWYIESLVSFVSNFMPIKTPASQLGFIKAREGKPKSARLLRVFNRG